MKKFIWTNVPVAIFLLFVLTTLDYNNLDTGSYILGCSRQYLNKLVKEGKITPIKETTRDKLFYKQDILTRKEKMRK